MHAFEVTTLLKVLVWCLEGGKTTTGICMMLDILDYAQQGDYTRR